MRLPKSMKPPKSESDVVAAVLRYLVSDLGLLAWRANQIPVPGRTFQGLRGVTDILGLLPMAVECQGYDRLFGVLLAIEIKMPKTKTGKEGKLRPAQAKFIDRVNASGGLAFVARGVDDVKRALRAEGVIS